MIRKSTNNSVHTESCRLLRGACDLYSEYLFESHTEPDFTAIGCVVVAHVINAKVLSCTYRGRLCE